MTEEDMAEDKRIEPEQVLKRGLGTDLAAAAISGVTGGVAGAVAAQAMSKLPRKPPDDPKK
jgi:hypothetical protein